MTQGDDPMTREAALARKAALFNDRAWGAKYIAGGAKERAELRQIEAVIAGEPTPAPSGSQREQAAAQLKALKADPEFRDRYLAGDASARVMMANLYATLAAETDQ
jgi:hypothetical protein